MCPGGFAFRERGRVSLKRGRTRSVAIRVRFAVKE